MKVNPISFIQGRIQALSMLSLMALIGLSSALQHYSSQSTKVLGLQDGLQTCFTRVHNTYTARLIGSGSDYLTPSFVQTSEECMGEVIRVYEDMNLANNVILSDLNKVATDLAWFHSKAIASAGGEGLFDGNPESVLLSTLGARYEKLEIKKDEINQGLINAKTSFAAKKASLSVFFYGIAALVPLFLSLDYFQRRKREEVSEASEKKAKELIKEGSEDSKVIHDLVLKTLEGLGMNHVARVFEINQSKTQSGKTTRQTTAAIDSQVNGKNARKDSIGRPVMLSQGTEQDQVDKIWSQGETTPRVEKREKERPSFDLEEALTNVIDHVSSKIFTLGIKLDIQSEPIQVYGERESLEQSFYNLLVNAIENYNFDDPHKFLRISTRKLGSTVLVDFFDSGDRFSLEFLRQAKGLGEGDQLHLDLSIAQGLIEESEGKITFENVANEDGELVGRKVQVVLEAARVASDEKAKRPSKRRLAKLEKTTKRELLQRIREENA